MGWLLLFLAATAVFQLPAQQTEADRKSLADLRAKAEKGDAQSQYDLGRAFDHWTFGLFGVTNDAVEAVKWYRRAAEQNHALAQSSLGVCYYMGDGVPKDVVEALKWWRKAAEQNVAEAQYNLAGRYANGEGVAKDLEKARRWYRVAQQRGDPDAGESLRRLG